MSIVSYADLECALPSAPALPPPALQMPALLPPPRRVDLAEIILTPAIAESLLLPGVAVHVMVRTCGERWTRGRAIDALREARAIRLTHPSTMDTGFAFAIERRSGEPVLMTADTTAIREWLGAQASVAAE